MDDYHKSVGKKKIVIKVDIVKAFNTISWSFVLNCLRGIGVPANYVRLVEACITTTSSTVGYSGQVHAYFKGKRGLRQGDLLSPYLFLIAMNCLSILLNKGAEEGKFNYHDKCAASKLTHLYFADNLFIFTDGTESSVTGVLEILEEFKVKSGLAVSIQKTAFYSSGLTPYEITTITTSTGLSHGSLPIRYLGVPLNSKKLTLLNCEPLLAQVKSKVNSWSAQSLSFAGRLLLVNTVVAGITNFWCATFVLPKALEKKEGGLGCRDLVAWNKACTLKLIWIPFCNSGSLWVAWYKKKVLNDSLSSFWTKKPNQKHSWFANKLLRIRDTAYAWVKIKIGNGATTRF